MQSVEVKDAYDAIVSDLNAIGIEMKGIDDLFHYRHDERVIDFILTCLERPIPYPVKIYIAHQLNNKSALKRRTEIVELMRRVAKQETTRDMPLATALCVAISAATTKQNLQETIDLALDRQLGFCRGGLLPALRLRRKRDPRVAVAIDQLRDDPDLRREIARWK